jgi:DeoR/GlpR family transcriptional regulator of sugar metabolism
VRWTLNTSAKERIGAAVAQLIPLGSRVILDTGTTVAEVARQLRGKELEVITASLPAASILGDDPTTRLTMLGGRVRPESLTVIGTDTEDAIRRFKADFCVLGTPGLANNAFYSLYPSEVAAQRAIIESSATSLLVADRTKMGLRQGVRVASLSELSAIVTDAPLDSSVGDDLPRVIVAQEDVEA